MIAFAATAVLLCTAPAPTSTLDDAALAAARTRYESFLFRWFEHRWGAEKVKQQLGDAAKRVTSPPGEACPIDATRGLFSKTATKSKGAWIAKGLAACPEDPDASDKAIGALQELSYHYENGFDSSVTAETCVPGACFFRVRAEYFEPAFWVALRDVPGASGGRTIVAGVFAYKRAPEDPMRDKAWKAWLAEIDKQFEEP